MSCDLVYKPVVMPDTDFTSKKLLTKDGEAGNVAYKDKGKDSSRALKLAFALIAASILLTLMTLLLAVLVLSQRQDMAKHDLQSLDAERPPIACIPCVRLLRDASQDIDDDPLLRKLTRKVKDGQEVCCAYTSEQTSAVFEAVMRGSEQQEVPLPSYNVSDFMFSPVSAHMRIYRHTDNAEVSRDFEGPPEFPKRAQVCEFRPQEMTSVEHYRGVDVGRSGFKIKHGGLYYLYTSILFRPQSTWPCHHFDYKTFAQYVERISPRHPSEAGNMLKTTHTCCDACVNVQESRFTGGLFMLYPGDVIQVKVTGNELVNFQRLTSFAGLVMLGAVHDEEKNTGKNHM